MFFEALSRRCLAFTVHERVLQESSTFSQNALPCVHLYYRLPCLICHLVRNGGGLEIKKSLVELSGVGGERRGDCFVFLSCSPFTVGGKPWSGAIFACSVYSIGAIESNEVGLVTPPGVNIYEN